MKNHLLIIDPQNDFVSPQGALSVTGAHTDMTRLSKYILDNSDNIDEITVTLDSHHRMHIAHPDWWVDSKGKNPDPFTIISKEDVESGKFKAAIESQQDESLNYVRLLEEGGKYPLCIWPHHCLIGTSGHNVFPELNLTLQMWAKNNKRVINYIFKGSAIDTESYSAFGPEVPTPSAQNHYRFAEDMLLPCEKVIVAGEASSHCVRSSVLDLLDYGKEYYEDESFAERVVLLKDCMSPVTGFEEKEAEFFDIAKSRGVSIINSTEL